MGCFKRRIAGYERKRGARVGDNGSTSYVRSFLGIFDRGRSRGARIMGNLQKRKGTKEISTRKGQALHARNAWWILTLRTWEARLGRLGYKRCSLDWTPRKPKCDLGSTELSVVSELLCCICSSTSARLQFRLPDGSSFLLMFLPEKIILDWQTVVAEDKL